MSQTQYSKSIKSDEIPNVQFTNYRKKFRIFCGLSVVLVILLLLLVLIAFLYFFGIIPNFNHKLNLQTKLHGRLLLGKSNDGIIEYLGIPYAMAPVGDKRFLHAKEIIKEKEFQEVYGDSSKPYYAYQYKPKCIQLNQLNNITGSEDCLYLNIYIPPSQSSEKLPVIFVINGLFFSFGSADMNGFKVTPEVVLATESIHVSCNYRLGPMNSFVNPINNQTNFGISDLLTALTWVYKNIAKFNGDPSNIMLFGVGSGSSMALALYNSHLASNLFAKLWISSPALWIKSDILQAMKYQQKYITNETKLPILQNQLKLDKLLAKYTWSDLSKRFQNNWFKYPEKQVAVDDNIFFILKDGYFIKDPNLLKQAPTHRVIPLIIGNNYNDVDFLPYPNTIRLWNKDYFKNYVTYKIAPSSSLKKEKILEEIETNYLKDKDIRYDMIYTEAISDIRSTCPINYSLKDMLRKSDNQFIYRYVLKDEHNNFDAFGTKHSTRYAFYLWDSILYFNGYKYLDDYGHHGEKERKMSSFLQKIMRKFAKDDKVEQLQVSNKYVRINLIENGGVQRDCYLKSNECEFWKSIFNSFNVTQWNV